MEINFHSLPGVLRDKIILPRGVLERIERQTWKTFVDRTAGASAAFIREMMRRAALFAADESSETVEDRHLDEATHELVAKEGSLTRNVLGFGSSREAE